MKPRFPGFPPEGIDFLRDLKTNNDRDWFQPRKAQFEKRVRGPMLDVVREIHAGMTGFAPEYVGDPAKSIYRIYRDTRFSKDKAPYKTHIAALFWHRGLGKDDGAGMFFLVSPDKIEIAGGLYMPEPERLFAVRSHVAANTAEFRKTFENRAVKKLLGQLQGEKTSRPPKGFDAAHPAIELLKHKQYILGTTLDSALAVTPKLFPEIMARLEAMTPFVEFLNRTPIAKARNAPWV
ncbi:MAG: DUF2461 domain-containing protein [Bryobacteraceae bacterium]